MVEVSWMRNTSNEGYIRLECAEDEIFEKLLGVSRITIELRLKRCVDEQHYFK